MSIPSPDSIVPVPRLPLPRPSRPMLEFLNEERLRLAEPATRAPHRYLQRLGIVVHPHGRTDDGQWACTITYVEGHTEPPAGAVWIEDRELAAGIAIPFRRVANPLLDVSTATILSVWRTQVYSRYPGGPMWQFALALEKAVSHDDRIIELSSIRAHLQGQQRRLRHPHNLLSKLCNEHLLAPMFAETASDATRFCLKIPPACACLLGEALLS